MKNFFVAALIEAASFAQNFTTSFDTAFASYTVGCGFFNLIKYQLSFIK